MVGMGYSRLKQLRQEHQLSQSAMGDILHISQRTYSHYEGGTRSIPVDVLIRLADYYEVSLDYLVGRTDTEKY